MIDVKVVGRRIVVALLAAVVWTQPTRARAQSAPDVAEPRATSPSAGDSGWWTPWYLVDYGLIAAGAAGSLVGENLAPADHALIGPQYQPRHPELLGQYDAISEPYLPEGSGETIPKEWVVAAVGAAGIYVGGLEASAWRSGGGSARQFHDTLVGYVEAVALTAGVTSLVKPIFGRLRPDFADRARVYLCNHPDAGGELDCAGFEDRRLADSAADADQLFRDGRRSFFSGHTSNSFSALTYTSLVIGGHYVWGDDATLQTRAAGVAAQSVLMGAATFVGATRLIDGRHHLTDVLAAGATGVVLANVSYWRRFDASGDPRGTGDDADADGTLAVHVGPAAAGVGLQLTLRR